VKKKLPIAVWVKIQPLIDKHLSLFRPLKSSEYAFHLVDLDEDSEFDFKCGFQDSNGNFKIEYAPYGTHHIHRHRETVNLETLAVRITTWANILQEYKDTSTFYDDPIEKRYEEYFFEKLEILDPIVAKEPLSIDKQLYLDTYINAVRIILEQYKADLPKHTTLYEIELIEVECERLQTNLKILPANEILKKLAKIWGKAHKFSLKLIIELLKEFKKEAIKKLSTEAINELFTTLAGMLGDGTNGSC
jgi:hypothetical protein